MVANTAGDTVNPNVSIASPTNGATISGTLTVSGSASDNIAVTKVELQLDTNAWITVTGTTSWQYSFGGSQAAGSHSLTARVTDTSGNVGTATTLFNYTTSGSLGTCKDGSEILQKTITAEGVKINICTTTGGWTTDKINSLLAANARDLELIGPTLSIQVTASGSSSTGTGAGCCTSAGRYDSFSASINLNASSTSTFSVRPDQILSHEYGHAWTMYRLFISQNNNWTQYLATRWAITDGSIKLSQDSRLDSSYNWSRNEMIADDYRLLFGSALAQSQTSYINAEIPDPRNQPGLRDWFITYWSAFH
jgi:hypothetical protein